MARTKSNDDSNLSAANPGFEAKLWLAAGKLRNPPELLSKRQVEVDAMETARPNIHMPRAFDLNTYVRVGPQNRQQRDLLCYTGPIFSFVTICLAGQSTNELLRAVLRWLTRSRASSPLKSPHSVRPVLLLNSSTSVIPCS